MASEEDEKKLTFDSNERSVSILSTHSGGNEPHSAFLTCILFTNSLAHFFCFFFLSKQALGFTESDSAGQTNIFAVQPKVYVAGTAKDDTTADGDLTNGAAAIAGTFAVGAVIGGLLLVKDTAPLLEDYPTEYLTLAEYKSEFAADFETVSAPSPAINES